MECAQIDKELLSIGESLRVGWFKPTKRCYVLDAASLQSQNGFREIESLNLGCFLRRSIEVIAFSPKAKAIPRCCAASTTGALLCRSAADLLNEQGIDPAPRIESANACDAAVDHDANAID